MKPASCSPSRLLTIAICAVLSASAAQAADKPEPNATQLPQQVLPTGAEDAVAEAAPLARSAVSAATTETQLLESELIEMTSESDEGLVEETLSDGSSMVDLQGRFMSVMMMTPTPDGGTAVGCYTGHDAVEHAKRAPDAATAKKPLTAPQALEEK